MNVTERASASLLAMLLSAGGAIASDGRIDAPDWKGQWLKARNELLETNKGIAFDPTSVLVRFEKDMDPNLLEAVKAAAGLHPEPIMTWSMLPGLEHLRVAEGDAEKAVQVLSMLPGVEYAELDQIVRTALTPNDPSYSLLWGLNNSGQTVNGDPGVAGADINAPEAWNIFTGDASFVIADIDSGVNYSHPDLAANAWVNPGETAANGVDDDANGYVDDIYGWNFYSNTANPMDDNGHGTHTAGTFGAVGGNGVGVTGVNWRCKIMSLKFLGGNGSGTTSGAISAVQYAVGKGVKVSNNSWGGGGYSQALYDAINASRSIGHVFVAAAGNNNTNTDATIYYPQGYELDNIISVAASDNNDARASFSNYGARTVDLAAPGVNIYSTYGSGYAYLNGTSMATPHVTGVVAMVQALNPSWSHAQVRQRILNTVRPVAAFSSITATGGVLDAFAAISTVAPPGNAPTVTIDSPSNGARFAEGATITFSGSASDVEDGNLSANLAWTSNIDGALGQGGGTIAIVLSAGSHVITAAVTDSDGRMGSTQIGITIAPPAPVNDACSAAISLSENVALSGSTAFATNDGTASCGSSSASPDVWFAYSTPGTNTVTIDTCGSTFDTVLSVYTGSCGGLGQVACNDDNGGVGPCAGGTSSYISFTPTAGQTYLIRVAGYAGAAGSFTVKASGGKITAPTAPAAPSNLTVSRSGSNSVLTWRDNSNNETRFVAQREQKVGNRWLNTTSYSDNAANDTSISVPTPAGTWRWRVRAENGALVSAWSSWLQQKVR